MSKFLLTAITLCSVAAAAVPALSQGYPGSLPYTNARTSTAYEESHGGLLGAVFGSESNPKPQSDPQPPSDPDARCPAS
jgi:hypothetical protein